MQDKKQQSIAEQVRAIRLKNDLTYEQFGEKAGVAGPTIYRIEKGIVDPNERTVYKIKKAFPELRAA